MLEMISIIMSEHLKFKQKNWILHQYLISLVSWQEILPRKLLSLIQSFRPNLLMKNNYKRKVKGNLIILKDSEGIYVIPAGVTPSSSSFGISSSELLPFFFDPKIFGMIDLTHKNKSCEKKSESYTKYDQSRNQRELISIHYTKSLHIT